jgi:hypothetical protein
MVAYHAINYSAYRPLGFRYLAFLPPSFILITGFLVGQVYATKYNADSWKPYVRLAIRGLKLLLLFTIFNLLNCIFLERNLLDGLLEFAERSTVIFLSGNGRTGIFEVLLPIAYFLLLAPALLWFRFRFPGSVAVVTIIIFLVCLSLEMNGKSYKNLVLLSAGFIGVALGLITMDSIDRLAKSWFLVVPLYAAYRFADYFLGEPYLLQMAGVVVTVLTLYACALRFVSVPWLGTEVVTFGQYSLFAYLAQIALLRAVVKIAGGRPGSWLGVICIASITTALLFVSVGLLHSLRQRSKLGDKLYRAVFA